MRQIIVGVVLGAACTLPAPVLACTTPVYRYAMYNWPPAPYFVFYFHPGEIPAEDEKVNEAIRKLADERPLLANVLLEPVDVSQKELERLPKPVLDAWREHVGENTEAAEPAHLVFTSWGAKLHAGRLDEATVKAMVESPLRTRIGQLLEEGCATVIVFLPGAKEEENKQAEEVAKDLIARAAAGQIPIESAMFDPRLYPGPASTQPPGGEGADEGSQTPSQEELLAVASRLKVGLVKVDSSQAEEKWLFDSLRAVEPDLGELAEQPMIFFAYGRGRAMPPYVGKGINAENLTAELQFLASACSCFVKEQNPGVDLLMRWDWDATAEAMAAHDPAFAGGPFGYAEFSPDASGNMVAAGDPGLGTGDVALQGEVPSGETPSPPAPGEASAPGAEPAESVADSPAAQAQPVAAAGAEASSEAPVGEAVVERVPLVSPRPAETDAGGSFASRQMWTFGLGLAAIALVVLVAGSILILKR